MSTPEIYFIRSIIQFFSHNLLKFPSFINRDAKFELSLTNAGTAQQVTYTLFKKILSRHNVLIKLHSSR